MTEEIGSTGKIVRIVTTETVLIINGTIAGVGTMSRVIDMDRRAIQTVNTGNMSFLGSKGDIMADRNIFTATITPTIPIIKQELSSRIINKTTNYEGVYLLLRNKIFLAMIISVFLFFFSSTTALAVVDQNKLIYVNLFDQTATLYNGFTPIATFPVMTGKDSTPTPTGWYKVWCKNECQTMEATKANGEIEYSLPNVHYCTYFNNGTGFHEAYWRDPLTFGTQLYHTEGSHSCINMTLNGAYKIYCFADIEYDKNKNPIDGTWVWVDYRVF
jgi:hypothetical protein